MSEPNQTEMTQAEALVLKERHILWDALRRMHRGEGRREPQQAAIVQLLPRGREVKPQSKAPEQSPRVAAGGLKQRVRVRYAATAN